MNRIKNYITLLSLLVLSYGCTKTMSSGSKNNLFEKPAQIQLIHASPERAGIKIWVNDSTMQAVGNYYKSNTHYMDIPKGYSKFELKLSKTEVLLFSDYIDILPGAKYSIFASDSQKHFTAFLTKDDQLPVQENMAQLRIVNILSTNESIEVELDDSFLFEDIKFKSTSSYQYFAPGQKNLSIRNSRSSSFIIKNVLVYLDPGVIYTLYVNGFTNQIGTYAPDAILVVNH
jgi:hypothetical protein